MPTLKEDVSTPLCAESLTYGSALYVVHALAFLSIGATFHNIELGAALGSRLCGQNYAGAIRLANVASLTASAEVYSEQRALVFEGAWPAVHHLMADDPDGHQEVRGLPLRQ